MANMLFFAIVLAVLAAILLSLLREIRSLRALVAGIGAEQKRSALIAERAAAIERATLPDARGSDTDLEDEVTRIVAPRAAASNDVATENDGPRSTVLPPPSGTKK